MLKLGQVCWAECISLGNDWNQVDARAKSLHDLDVKGLECVSGRADEVQASVHTEINLVLAAGLLLLKHVGFMLVVEELDDRHPRVPVVDIIAEAGSIDHGQANYDRVRSLPESI